MKSIVKFVMTGIGLVLIGTGVAALVFSTQALALLKTAVEQRAEEALGAEVTIEAVEFSREEAGIVIRGFNVSNPQEFKEGDAITCGQILLKPAWNALFAETPRFEAIVVDDLRINLRHETRDGTNIGALLRNIRTYLESIKDKEPEAIPRQIRADHLVIESGSLKVSSNIFPIPAIPLDIHRFEVKNVDEGKPVPVGKLMGVFIRDVLREGITLKGLLKPIEGVLQTETQGI